MVLHTKTRPVHYHIRFSFLSQYFKEPKGPIFQLILTFSLFYSETTLVREKLGRESRTLSRTFTCYLTRGWVTPVLSDGAHTGCSDGKPSSFWI